MITTNSCFLFHFDSDKSETTITKWQDLG